jgi:hypothetical protein
MKHDKKQSAFAHDYPSAPGVTKDGTGAGGTPHRHPYPAGGMGVTRSDAQGAAGHSPHLHDYPHHRQLSGGPTVNKRGSARVPLTHMLKKRAKGGVHTMGKRM